MIVVAVSLEHYIDEASAKRRELAALLEQGYAIVSVTAADPSAMSVSLIVTLQAPIRAVGAE